MHINSDTDQPEELQKEQAVPQETPQVQPQVPDGLEAEGPKDPNRRWYVVHTYSGYENKVQQNLLRRIESFRMKDKIFQVLVPTEEEIEFRDGKRRTVQKKIYPGYVMVEMIMANDTWYVVRNTPGVTGFVGPVAGQTGTQSSWPTPLPDEEVEQILRVMGMVEPVKVKIDLQRGQAIRVTHGPFQDFHGVVEEVNPEREKVKVLITIFGRETPVELDFGQVEKLAT
ncbi:MAG: transcription termination/antitermination protein NusG [Candidatus Xenobia bacterium]